jgi:hypothetical protein
VTSVAHLEVYGVCDGIGFAFDEWQNVALKLVGVASVHVLTY